MIARLGDILKEARGEVRKSALFIGASFPLQPVRRTTRDLLSEAATRWATEHGMLAPGEVEESASAAERALEMLASEVTDGIERCRIARPYFQECRPSEGHIRLAGLIREQFFSTIFTTAIDGLLEEALEQQRLLPGREYIRCVLPTTSADEVRLALNESSRVVIVKLLGDLDARVLPLTREECVENLRRIGDTIGEHSAKTCILANIGQRDRPLLRFVSPTGGDMFWVSEHVPVGDREAFDDLKLDSPDTLGFHEYLPRAVKLLTERGCRENVLCREVGGFDAFFAQLHTRLIRRRHRHHSQQKKTDITLLPGGPYRFLEHFDTKHADLFFGRERDIDALCDMVEQHRLLVLFGASGMGKTSLLKAGLMAAVLGEDEEQERPEYLPIYVRGLDDPAPTLKGAIVHAMDQHGMETDLHMLESPLAALIDQAAAVLPNPLLIILDQFEEHFVRLGLPARDSFLHELSNAVAGCDPSVRFVIAVREDFLGQLFELRSRIPGIFENMYRLGRLSRDGADAAITKPAAHFGIHVDTTLADRIVDDLYKEGVEPPQLQIVCDRLYGLLGEGRHYLRMKYYEQEGSAQAILDNWVERVLSRLARRERVAARTILKLLITAQETRASLPLEAIAAEIDEGVEGAARMVAHLVDLRMIREVEEAPGTFELVHEYVAHAIRGWISERELRVKDVQELLGRQVNSWRKFGILMHSDELNLVHEYRDSLPMSRDELGVVVRSAASAGFELDYWLGRLEELRDRQFPLLRDMLHDHHPAVRCIAVGALAQLEDRRALSLLIDALDDSASEVRHRAEEGLRGNERELMDCLRDSSIKVRDGAARALGRIGSRRGARELLERLRDDDVGVRRSAAEALQSVPDARLTGPLLRLLDTPPASWAAAQALASVGSDAEVLGALGDSSGAEASAEADYVVAKVHLTARRLEQAAAHLARAEAACTDEEGARLIAAAHAELARAQERRGDAAPSWDMFRKDPRRSGASGEAVPVPLEEAWRYRADDFVASSPALVNELVYVGARDGCVHCLELATGASRWRFTTQDRVESSPAIGGNALYVGSHDGRVYAIDARNGEEIWATNLQRPVRASCNLVDNLVVIGCWDGALYGLDAATGRQRWRFESEGEVYSSAAVANGTAFVGSWDGRLYAIDCEDGGKRWEYATGGEIFSSPALPDDDGVIVFGSDDGAVYALDASSAELIWRHDTKGAVRSSPAVANGCVYVGSLDGGLYALQLADGKQRWAYTTGEEIVSSPAVAGDLIFVGSRDGALYALSADSGEELWRQSTAYGIVSSPAVCGGHVVVGMEYYYVCAFRTREGA